MCCEYNMLSASLLLFRMEVAPHVLRKNKMHFSAPANVVMVMGCLVAPAKLSGVGCVVRTCHDLLPNNISQSQIKCIFVGTRNALVTTKRIC